MGILLYLIFPGITCNEFLFVFAFAFIKFAAMKRYINSIKNLAAWMSFWKEYYEAKGSDPGNSFLAKLRSGLNVEVPHVLISAFDEVFLRDVYKGGTKDLSYAPVVLDIGANVGYFSLYMFSKYPQAKILAFEPLPVNYKLLEKHKEINSLTNLTIDKRAVHGTEKNIRINFNKDIEYSVGASVINRSSANTALHVQAVSIPDIFDDYNLLICDLLKIDCEGAEYNILFNCPDEFYHKIKNIVIEAHDWAPESEGTINTLAAFLQSKKYAVSLKRNGMLWCHKIHSASE